jgi:hypothetical protein
MVEAPEPDDPDIADEEEAGDAQGVIAEDAGPDDTSPGDDEADGGEEGDARGGEAVGAAWLMQEP